MSNQNEASADAKQNEATKPDGHDPALTGMLFEQLEDSEQVFGTEEAAFNEVGAGVDLGEDGGLDDLLKDGEKPKPKAGAAKTGAMKAPQGKARSKRSGGKKQRGARKAPAGKKAPMKPGQKTAGQKTASQKTAGQKTAAQQQAAQAQPQPKSQQKPQPKPQAKPARKGFWARLLGLFGIGKK